MQRQRFEYKYLLEEAKALEVRNYITELVGKLELDEAGIGKHNFSYRVSSLYLDSDTLVTFWDWVNSNRNRFKLRMRYYEDKSQPILPSSPLFLEIKRRISGCILKQRCVVKKAAAEIILAGQTPPPDQILSPREDSRQGDALTNFVGMVSRLGAKPKALVTYLREAYVDPANEAVRITLDREVRIAPREALDFSLNMDQPVQPFGHMVILELKFTNRFPDWCGDMVRALSLDRSAAAKYCEGLAAMNHPEMGDMQSRGHHRRRMQSV